MTASYSQYIVAFLISFCCSLAALANDIKVSGSQGANVVTLSETGQSAKQLLHINSANASGISVNHFSRFQLTNLPLYIVNAGPDGRAASTIVLVTDAPKLNNTMILEGNVADIIIVSKGRSGRIDCNGCVFEKFNRITLATADPEDATFNTLGVFKPGSSSRITITNLKAPGALSVDVLTNDLSTSGTISTVERLEKAPGGQGYRRADGGRYRSSAGRVGLIAGIPWHYEAMSLHKPLSTSSVATLNADMETNTISISTAGVTTLSGTIDTQIELMSSVMYRGELRVNNEHINIASLGASTLNVNNIDLRSHGEVFLSSGGDLHYNSGAVSDVHYLQLIAKSDLKIRGTTKSIGFSAEAENIINEGDINARSLASLKADYFLINRSGGVIQSDRVRLETNTDGAMGDSYVLNGSRTPFESFDKTLLPYTESYLQDLDKTRLGTFYNAKVEERFTLTNLSKPAKTSAHIIANKLYVRTKAFENINPYYVNMNKKEALKAFDRTYENQVSVIAQETIEIGADNYVLNSSAKLGTEGVDSKILIKAPLVVNERYRVFVGLEKRNINEVSEDPAAGTVTTTTGTGYYTKIYSYSPAGALYSMGDLDSEARYMFLNSLGYLEILGNARFATPMLNDRGIELQGVERVTGEINNGQSICEADPYSCITRTYDFGQSKPNELDSFFYINGSALALASANSQSGTTADQIRISNGVTDHANYSPYGAYVLKEIADVQATMQLGDGNPIEILLDWGDRGYTTNYLGISGTSRQRKHSFDLGDTSFSVTVSRETHFSFELDGEDIAPGAVVHDTVETSEKKTMSVWQSIISQFTKLASKMKTFFAELAWWN